jgi:hypothetical protein
MDAGPCIDRAIESAVKALREGGESPLCAANALRTTELIFAGYESARKRARIDLPLTIKDNPLADLFPKKKATKGKKK